MTQPIDMEQRVAYHLIRKRLTWPTFVPVSHLRCSSVSARRPAVHRADRSRTRDTLSRVHRRVPSEQLVWSAEFVRGASGTSNATLPISAWGVYGQRPVSTERVAQRIAWPAAGGPIASACVGLVVGGVLHLIPRWGLSTS